MSRYDTIRREVTRTSADASTDRAAGGPQRVWDGVIALAGAATGLTALVYVIGAVTMCARLRSAGLPTDVALQHEPRAQVLAIGARGAVAIVVAIAVTYILVYLLLLVAAYVAPLVWKKSDTAARDKNLLDFGGSKVRELNIHVARSLAAAGLGLVVAASFDDWRTFAVAIAFGVATAGTLRYLFERSERKRPSLALLLGILAGAALAAIAWQIQPPVLVQTVIVVPVGGASLADVGLAQRTQGVAIPYLGESSDYVYVAEIRNATHAADGTYSWTFTRSMVEIPRKDVRLIFPAQKGQLKHSLPSPAESFWAAAKATFGDVEQ